MKKHLSLLFILFLFSTQAFSQVAGSSFEMYVMNWRFGPQSLDYFADKNIEVTNLLAINNITSSDRNKVDANKVRQAVRKLFPGKRDGGKLVLDWETSVFKDLRNHPKSDSRYKTADKEWRKLISIVREERPNVEIGIYGMPFRSWHDHATKMWNENGKLDDLLSLTDFLAPSVYLQYADEEVGRARNLEYIRDNMNYALEYGKRLRKPVYPFFWHRVHPSNVKTKYPGELIQTEAFADYIKYLSTYSYNGYKSSGAYWWEVVSKKDRLKKVKGVKNWVKKLVKDDDDYDALMVDFAKAVVKELSSNSSERAPEPSAAPEPETASGRKVVSYTLVNANTGKDIMTVENGATLNLASLPTKNLNIRANTSPVKVGSVVFSLSGKQSRRHTETQPVYALFGGDKDYDAWTPTAGSYTLKATPFSERGGKGKAGKALTIEFKVVGEKQQAERSLILVDADTDQDIMTLEDGATLDLATLPTRNLNIRADFGSEKVGSTVFALSGKQSRKQTESGKPHALFSDDSGDYHAWTPAAGSYTLKATAYSKGGGKGTAGTTLDINFKVVNGATASIEGVSESSDATVDFGSHVEDDVTADADGVALYPNPATTVLNVEMAEAESGSYTISLTTFNGDVVLTQQEEATSDGLKTVLDLNGVKQGLYILQIISSEERITKRIAVE